MSRRFLPLALSITAWFGVSGAIAAGDAAHEHSADHHRAHGAAAAIGVPGSAGGVTRTVKLDMTDAMRFSPASVTVKQGETIRFVVANAGRVKHEFVLGTDQELKAHYEQMKKFPDMEHADPNQVTVAPGQTGEVIWRFTTAGKVSFACLQPGHYDAGMTGAVKVDV